MGFHDHRDFRYADARCNQFKQFVAGWLSIVQPFIRVQRAADSDFQFRRPVGPVAFIAGLAATLAGPRVSIEGFRLVAAFVGVDAANRRSCCSSVQFLKPKRVQLRNHSRYIHFHPCRKQSGLLIIFPMTGFCAQRNTVQV